MLSKIKLFYLCNSDNSSQLYKFVGKLFHISQALVFYHLSEVSTMNDLYTPLYINLEKISNWV